MSEINRNTKISTLLKEDKRALDALAAFNPKFERLKNPLLRKLLAARTSVGQAAKIGGCTPKEIGEVLRPLGFEFKETVEERKVETVEPDFVKNQKEEDMEVLDVRPDIEKGNDPLKKIMKTIKGLPAGKILKIINSFEPTPLVNVLEKKGYESYIQTISPEEVHAFFKLKEENGSSLESEVPDTVSEEVYTRKLAEFGDKVAFVDVHLMAMPMPMVTILEELSELPEGYVLRVQHKRIPVFLFSELKERNFDYLVYQAGENDVKLLIFYKMTGP